MISETVKSKLQEEKMNNDHWTLSRFRYKINFNEQNRIQEIQDWLYCIISRHEAFNHYIYIGK